MKEENMESEKNPQDIKNEKIKKLTGEQYFNRFEEYSKNLMMFAAPFAQYREYTKNMTDLKSRLLEKAKAGEVLDEILAEIGEVEGDYSKAFQNHESAKTYFEIIKKFGNEYGLDLNITFGMTPEQIINEIEKSHHAKLFKIQGNME